MALDLELDDGLRREGLARELVRALNDLRKEVGLAIADRVRLTLEADGAVADAARRPPATTSRPRCWPSS